MTAALPILMAAFAVICFGYLGGNLVVLLELQRLFVRNAAIALVFNVVLNLLLIPPYGFLAAAWVTLATEVLVTVLTLGAALRSLELRLRVRRLLLAAAAARAMTFAVALLQELGAPLRARRGGRAHLSVRSARWARFSPPTCAS